MGRARRYERLQTAEPEALAPQLRGDPAMVLNVIARPGDAVHGDAQPDPRQPQHVRRQARARRARRSAYRALLAAGVIERLDVPDATGRTVRLTADLPPNFALNQPLSTFALAALDLLDRESPTPTPSTSCRSSRRRSTTRGRCCRAQQFQARGEAVAAMKAEGIEYDERMELLEDVTHPQPLAELLERGVRDLPAEPSVGGRGSSSPPSRSCATCGSAR